MKRPIVVDLFAGVGGMSLGFEAAGFDVAAAVEMDPIHAALHHYNFPYTTTLCTDIHSILPQQLEESLRKYGTNTVDLLIGGPPCQGFSQIGKRQLDDPRNKLVFEYLRVLGILKPKYFVFENVPGMLAGKHLVFIQELLEAFSHLNYNVVLPYKVLDAAQFGVAQHRRRLILLGYRNDVPAISYPSPAYSSQVHSQLAFDGLLPLQTSRDMIGDLANIPIFIKNDQGLTGEYQARIKNSLYANVYNHCHQRSFSSKGLWGHLGSLHSPKSIEQFQQTPPGTTEKTTRFFRLHPDQPSHTLRAGTASDRGAYTAPRPIHYQHARCISIREAARLHSYPDWFQFHRTIWHGFRQIGNSVTPLLARSIGLKIQEALGNDARLEALSIYSLEEQKSELCQFDMSTAATYFKVRPDVISPRRRPVRI
jgi:DNA (cytosine-5)-methyltransferase 1